MDTSIRADELAARPGSGPRGLIDRLIGDRDWVRPGYLAVLGLTAVLYMWGLDRNGYANTYYSAAVLAGTKNWKAFFFGSLDAGNFITVDKPPASLWLMELSGRIFGFSSWSLLLPQALLGVATVALVFAIVKRTFGPVAGLIAALVTALTPVAVVMFRFNNPDALLTFLMVVAAWATLRSIATGRTRWLLVAAAIVGLAFNTKYLQAYIVLPALVVTYLLVGPGSWSRRVTQLFAAAGVLLVSSGWWLTIVTLIPADSRPFIGGSTDNSVLNLVFGYDGLSRITGAFGSFGRGAAATAGRAFAGGGPGPGGGPGFGGQAGILRLFNTQDGGQISWLLPLAAAGLAAGLWGRRGQPRTDLARAAYVLWGVWLLAHAVVFSFMSGIFHPYYTVAMAPAVGALVGGGVVELARWRSRSVIGGAIAATALLATAWWGSRLLGRTPEFAPGLGTVELILALLAAIVFLAPRTVRLPGRLPQLALAGGLAAVLLGPAAYAFETAARGQTGPDASAGPSVAARFGTPGTPVTSGTARFGAAPPLQGGAGFGAAPGFQRARGPGGFEATADSALVSYLKSRQGSATWLVAVSSANAAAPIQLATGRPVLAMGGFSGSDPAMTVTKLQQLVRSGQLRYVLLGGGPGGRGGFGRPPGAGDGGTAGSVSSWVTQNCTVVNYSGSSGSSAGSVLYDCSAAVSSTGGV